MLYLSVLWIYIIYVRTTTAEWNMSSQPLPVADDEQAVGEYDGTIFILGGYNQQQQLTTYHIATDMLTDEGGTLIGSVHGSAQYWTHQNHIIYMLDFGNTYINTFNMIRREFTEHWESINITIHVDSGCLASDAEYLYITGGKLSNGTVHNELQTLSFSTKQWIYNASSMQEQKRNQHGCIVYNEYLWVFGGKADHDSILNTNERISTINITRNIWNYIDPFTTELSVARAAAFDNTIYVIGGRDLGNNYLDIVHLVDATTGTVTVDKLLLGNCWGAPIIVDAVLYVFGGFYDQQISLMDVWMYYQLDTSNPTVINSTIPTVLLSNNPVTDNMDSKDGSQQNNPLLDERTLVFGIDIIATILLIICIIAIGYALYKKRHYVKQQKVEQIVQMEIQESDNDDMKCNVVNAKVAGNDPSKNMENMVLTVEGDLDVAFRRTIMEGKQYEENDHDNVGNRDDRGDVYVNYEPNKSDKNHVQSSKGNTATTKYNRATKK